eukprot:TRINITY_DN22646_c0_g3_i1.p1 TRINITY_DN22646_c0_g3~~TRINITY_DN22646_c0_g3_i1.p1  ORF type:complete len:755 (+),score=90.07 TRINITY_DN22646_c0_g3_i1:232-2265(+)
MSRSARASFANTSRACCHIVSIEYVCARVVNLAHTAVSDAWVGRVLRQPSGVQSLDISCCPLLTQASLIKFARFCPHLQCLHIAASPWLTDQSLKLVAPRLIGLRELDISDCPQLTHAALQDIAQHCSNLQTLTASCSVIFGRGFLDLLEKCKGLRSLNVTDKDHTLSVKSRTVIFQHMARYCRSLRELSLVNFGTVSHASDAEALKELAASSCSLRELSLDCENYAHADVVLKNLLQVVQISQHLRLLDLQDCMSDESLGALLRHCPSLRQLRLRHAAVTDPGMKSIVENCPNLSELELRYGTVTDVGIEVVAQGCRQLQTFSLNCECVTESGIKALGRHCRNLTDISIFSANQYSDVSVQCVAQHCPSLRSMLLKGTSILFGDKGLEGVAQHCRYLQKLGLRSQRVTDHGLQIIAEACCALEELDVDQCGELTDIGFQAVAKCCPNLRVLKCGQGHQEDEDCPRLSNVGLQCLARGCPHLETIDMDRKSPHTRELALEFAASVTDEALQSLALCCPALKDLDFSGSAGLTDAGWKEIAQHCKLLQTMHLTGPAWSSAECLLVCADHCKFLQNLDIAECGADLDAGLQAIGAKCFSLKWLRLTFCDFVTDAGISWVLERPAGLPSCHAWGCQGVSLQLKDQLISITRKLLGCSSDDMTNDGDVHCIGGDKLSWRSV